MTTQTTNYSFTKDDINEPYDVLRVNANLDAIDTEIKKKETQIGDKANLVTVTKTNLVAAINEVKEQTNSLGANKVNKASEEWITATLQNGWTGIFQYKKNDLGQVFIKANIISGTVTSGTLVTTLPVGYRTSIDKSILANRYDTGLTKLGFRQQLNGEFKIFGTDITAGTYQIVDDFYAG